MFLSWKGPLLGDLKVPCVYDTSTLCECCIANISFLLPRSFPVVSTMGFKNHRVADIIGLCAQRNYTRQFQGMRQRNFRQAFFASRNSTLCCAPGCWQLLYLYLACIFLRVALRVLKHRGVNVRMIERFIFSWEVKPRLELPEEHVKTYGDAGCLCQELLNYSNVFNDYYWAKRRGLKLRNDDILPRFLLANAAIQPSTRWHDVRKDKFPLREGTQACDPKWVRFMQLLNLCTTFAERALLLCAWITTRHTGSMEAVSRGDPIPADWKADIPLKARDIGLSRENARSVGRGAAVIEIILRQQRLTWKQLLDHCKSIYDWGRFKAQHLAWNLHLADLITIVDKGGQRLNHDSWALPRGIVSDRATLQLAARFLGAPADVVPCLPVAKKRKRGVSALKYVTGEYHVFQDPCGFENEQVSSETLIKFVDSVVYANRANINCSVFKVGVVCSSNSELTWYDVPLDGTISEDALDNRFALLANFCQIEKLIKIWFDVGASIPTCQ